MNVGDCVGLQMDSHGSLGSTLDMELPIQEVEIFVRHIEEKGSLDYIWHRVRSCRVYNTNQEIEKT